MKVDMSCVAAAMALQEMPWTFGTGEYTVDVRVGDVARCPTAMDASETAEEALRSLLKTDRQKWLYAELQKRLAQGAES